eukprot:4864808-Amphidinium_carterae.1
MRILSAEDLPAVRDSILNCRAQWSNNTRSTAPAESSYAFRRHLAVTALSSVLWSSTRYQPYMSPILPVSSAFTTK